MSRRLDPKQVKKAILETREQFEDSFFPKCPLCNVPMKGNDGRCPECDLYYSQAEKVVQMMRENGVTPAAHTTENQQQESKKANRAGKAFLTIILNLAGFLAAFVAFFLIYVVLYWVITFIGRIPLLGAIIYWPSDASWVRLVTCISSAVFGGAWLSTVIAKNAKLFSGAIIAIQIFTILRLFVASAFTFTNLIECAVAIICAAMCLLMRKDDA